MLNIELIRENTEAVEAGLAAKNITADLSRVIELDTEERRLHGEIDGLRAQINNASKGGKPTPDVIAKIKEVKERLKKVSDREQAVEKELHALLNELPNIPAPDVKVGVSELDNEIIKTVGQPTQFDFAPKDANDLAIELNMLTMELATRSSGARFGAWIGMGALLEFALARFAFDTLVKEGFVPIIPPVLIKPEAMAAMGYLSGGGESETYHFTGQGDDLYLVGTSEQTIGAMHANHTFEESDLTKRYVAFSSCFRREAGTYGKDKGMFRVHQFDKVEMFSFAKPEDSDAEHEYLRAVEEKFLQSLGLPYQVVKMCTADLGYPAARKYDLEAWFPFQQKYRELTSTSNCSDWQARGLKTKYKPADGSKPRYVHTLNGTAFALSRTPLCIIENYQQVDGSVVIPEVLCPYLGIGRIPSLIGA